MAKRLLWLFVGVVVLGGCTGTKSSPSAAIEAPVSTVSTAGSIPQVSSSGSVLPTVVVVEASTTTTTVLPTGGLRLAVVGASEASVVVSGVAPGSFVVAYTDAGAVPGELLGSSDLVRPGSEQKVTVKFSAQSLGSTVWLVLHRDVDNNGILDYPGVDLPVSGQFGVTSVSAKVGAK
jgi:hypothetical protein